MQKSSVHLLTSQKKLSKRNSDLKSLADSVMLTASAYQEKSHHKGSSYLNPAISNEEMNGTSPSATLVGQSPFNNSTVRIVNSSTVKPFIVVSDQQHKVSLVLQSTPSASQKSATKDENKKQQTSIKKLKIHTANKYMTQQKKPVKFKVSETPETKYHSALKNFLKTSQALENKSESGEPDVELFDPKLISPLKQRKKPKTPMTSQKTKGAPLDALADENRLNTE
jgi:hypothetical protein